MSGVLNFRGIRERDKLDFRPITLLFGANSAGKSTVLHALLYAREVFERHNLDADQSIAGGKQIALGRAVKRHELQYPQNQPPVGEQRIIFGNFGEALKRDVQPA